MTGKVVFKLSKRDWSIVFEVEGDENIDISPAFAEQIAKLGITFMAYIESSEKRNKGRIMHEEKVF